MGTIDGHRLPLFWQHRKSETTALRGSRPVGQPPRSRIVEMDFLYSWLRASLLPAATSCSNSRLTRPEWTLSSPLAGSTKPHF